MDWVRRIEDETCDLLAGCGSENVISYGIRHTLMIAGFIDESELVAFIDERMPKINAHKVTHGQAIAVLLLCLSAGQYNSMTGALEQLKGIPIRAYLRLPPEIQATDFGRDILVSALDALYEYDSRKLFAEFSAHVVKKMMASAFHPEAVSLDTTSVSSYKKVRAKLSPLYEAIWGQANPSRTEDCGSAEAEAETETGSSEDDEVVLAFNQSPIKEDALEVTDDLAALSESSQRTPISIEFGYPKNRRTDLGQYIMASMVSVPEGIPLGFCLHNGSASDKTTFAELASELLPVIRASFETLRFLVADSAACTKECFDATLSQDLHVISRVSDNFKQVKEIMADFPNLADKLQPLDYKDPDGDCPMGVLIPGQLFGREVNFLAVDNPKLSASKRDTCYRRGAKESDGLRQKLNTKFKCLADAQEGVRRLQAKAKYCTVTHLTYEQACAIRLAEAKKKEARTGKPVKVKLPMCHEGLAYEVRQKHRGVGRPKQGAEMETVSVKAICTVTIDKDKIEQAVERERRYVLVCTDKSLPPEKIVRLYKGNHLTESLWALFKNRRLTIAGSHFHRTDRIEGLLTLVAISLLAHRVIEHLIRKAAQAGALSIPTQDGKGVEKKPTARRVLNYLSRSDLGINVDPLTAGVRIRGCNPTIAKLAVVLGPAWKRLLMPQTYRGIASWDPRQLKELS